MPDFSTMPEAFVSKTDLASAISREVKRGNLRKLASRLYTRNLRDSPEQIVRRNLWPLVASHMPGALIADRTALENQPAADGSIFLVSDHKRDVAMPGVTLRPRKGPPPLDSDRPFISSLRLSSPARAFLENMRPSRARSGVSRTLSRHEIEERLDEILRRNGEEVLQCLRDEVRIVGQQLGLQDEFHRLDALIGSFLGTRKTALKSSVAIARAAGLPYDPQRLDILQRLHTEVAGTAPVSRGARNTDGPALPFFEAYFSNFIEGTEFAVDEAVAIVFEGRIPNARPEDAHDVLGTWKVTSDKTEMSRLPQSFEDLKTILKDRHTSVMEGRPTKRPGTFKTDLNRAGTTIFVAPELVDGTLAKGFEIYRSLTAPLHRAVFMMFLVSEVHPFDDGNGRVARLMMNAELVATGETRILVPTVYRNNYLIALKALSQGTNVRAFLQVLDFAQRYTAVVDFSDLERARFILDRTHAFMDPNEAESVSIRLVIPSSDIVADAARLGETCA